MIIVVEGKRYLQGQMPEPDAIDGLLDWLGKQPITDVFSCDHLSEQFPPASTYKESVSGVIATALSSDMRNCLVWLRKEKTQPIKWAGRYEQGLVQTSAGNYQLNPRNSFESWTELAHGLSTPWSPLEIKIVKAFRPTLSKGLAEKNIALLIENKRAELLERLQKMTSRLPGVIYQFRLQPDGRSCLPYASQGIQDIFKVTPEDVCEDASRIFALIHPDDYEAMWLSIQQSAQNLKPWNHEFRVKFADGTVSRLLGDALPEQEADGVTLWHGFITDITERKQAEMIFRSVFDQSSFLAGILDQAGRLVEVNSSAVLLSNASREALIGQYFPDTPWWSNAQDRAKLIEVLALAYQGTVASFEGTHPTANGGHINVLFSAMPIALENSTYLAVFGVDITERKRNETLIRENEQHLYDILNVSPIAVRITINQGKEIVYYNPSYSNLIKNTQAKGINPDKHYAKTEDYYDIMAELTNGHTVINRQIEFRRPKDGSTFWALSSYMPTRYKGQEATLGWFYDITEQMELRNEINHQLELQQEAKHILQLANQEQQAIFDSATSGIALIKQDNIQHCNRKLEALLGYAPGEFIDLSVILGCPMQANSEIVDYPDAQQRLPVTFQRLERQLLRKDDSLFWARLSSQALDRTNLDLGVVWTIDDITAEHESADASRKAQELAEQATRMKSEFLANMSHEIRTPMNGVLGMLDLLADTDMTDTQREWLGTAHSSAAALLEIINDILDLSKLEANQVNLEQVNFNVVDLVDDICALMSGRAQAKHLELTCLVPTTLALCWLGDPLRIRQVITNLLSNAIKFTQQGEVSLSVSVNPAAVTNGQATLRFEVRDTGIGISDTGLSRLFKSFSQADNSTSRQFGGSGLGLFISKKLVELMGGTLGVDSVLDQGSCFWFTLPVLPGVQPEHTQQANDLTGKRVLIIDDNATNRHILTHYLSHWRLTVNAIDSGMSALIHLQTLAGQGSTYDVIVLDMQMPVMDGLSLAKCMAQIPALAKLPIILLSSSHQLELADYQETGIVQRVQKPARQAQLFDALVNALQGNSPAPNPPVKIDSQKPGYHDKKVLVVEDNKINQKVIFAKLAQFDIVPELAENGQLALDKLAHATYDLIFMDCHMPIMDGYVATRELRLLETRQGLPSQPVVALTANAMEGEREKCLAVGMTDYLTKPIITEQLASLLAQYLGSSTSALAPVLATEQKPSEIEWNPTAALKHLDNDSDLLEEMIAIFLTEAPQQLHELTRYQAQGKLPDLASTAHALKGAVGHFYAAPVIAAAKLLENTARTGQPADYQSMTEAVVNTTTALMNKLRQANI